MAAYFVGGMLTLLHPRQEVFPVFSWFLFSLAPQRQTRYAILLHEVRGQVLERARLYSEADGLVSDPHNVVVDILIQDFGASEVDGQAAKQREFRRLMEANYLPPRTRYELVKITFDPLARLKNGTYEVQSLRMFSTTESSP